MTIASNTPSFIQIPGNGTATNFSFPFKIFAATDLIVGFIIAGQYSVQSGGFIVQNIDINGGGFLSFSTPPLLGTTVDIRTRTPLTQTTEFANLGAFLPEAHTEAFDRLTREAQDLLRLTYTFGIHGPDNEATPWPALPSAPARANLGLLFDSNGLPTTGLLPTGTFTQAIWNAFLAGSTPYLAQIQTLNQQFNDADNIESVCQALEANISTSIAFFGDSTLWGAIAGPLTQAATPPYAQCVGAINNFFGNSAATAANFSISGTTLAQMLAGTDGSGLTYAARLAGTNAPVVYMNHQQNDAAGGVSIQTTAAVYRANLITCIQLTRAVGKSLIFVTAHPSLTISTFGSQFRAEQVSRFRDIMLDVAAQHGVRVVDNFKWLRLYMETLYTYTSATQIQTPLTILPDGVHGLQATYTFTGNNLADGVLRGMTDTLTGPDQRITANRPCFMASGQVFGLSNSSDFNATALADNAGGTGTQTMRIIFRNEVAMDISLLHTIYAAGAGGISFNLDGAQTGLFTNWSQVMAGFTSANYLQEVETCFVRNLYPGWHQLTLTTSGPGSIVVAGLRSRAVSRAVQKGSSAQDMSVRQLLTPKLSIVAGSVTGPIVITDICVSRFTENLELEWTGQMVKNSEIIIGAILGAPGSAQGVERMIGFGLNGSGFAHFIEATAPGVYTNTAFDAVDHSGGSHTYRVVLTAVNPGTISFFIDDAQIGSTTALAQVYFGGWLGAWKNLNTDVFTVTQVSRVWHF